MKEFWSSRIRSLTPYTPGEQPKERKYIKLNTNENPYPPSPKAVDAIREAAGDALRLYPDPEATELVRALAGFYRLDENQIFVGNGSDEVLAFAFQAFFSPGDRILFPDISYSFYPVYAGMFGIDYRAVPLRRDFSINPADYYGDNSGVVIANPNAPTGMELAQDSLRAILDHNPDVAVIVDEAYIDFGGTSALPLIREYPNLLVVQTTSKSRALAGLRVGFAFGNPNLIAALNCVKNSINSYTLDRLAIVGAAAAVRDERYFRTQCARIMATRDRTARRLGELGFHVLPSKSNFLFASHPDRPAAELFKALREQGILVRYFSLPRIDNYLRISVGTDEEMEALLRALSELTRRS